MEEPITGGARKKAVVPEKSRNAQIWHKHSCYPVIDTPFYVKIKQNKAYIW